MLDDFQNTQVSLLVDASVRIGQNAFYIQGGGGNTSVKLSPNLMAVKASGLLLKNASSHNGFAVVDYQEVLGYLPRASKNQDKFTKDISTYAINGLRPSIETGFHAMLGRNVGSCVIHTHSVFANLINCSLGGEGLLSKIWPDAIFVPYATPGRDITLALLEVCNAGDVFFLQNHGLVVVGSHVKQAEALHTIVNKAIVKFFGLQNVRTLQSFVETELSAVSYLSYMQNHVLFPDQVVYTANSSGLAGTQAGVETIAAHMWLMYYIRHLGLEPCFIPPHLINILQNLESEKYRQSLVSKI
jgi:rhamnose utilization protein RhaD (predicted bifunctional aldolase and dehydrogenase)